MIEIRELKKEDNFKDLFSLSKEFFREYQKHERKYFEINKLSQKNIIEFFKKTLNFNTNHIRTIDQLRYFRNGILYYGKQFDKEYAEKITNLLEIIYNKLSTI